MEVNGSERAFARATGHAIIGGNVAEGRVFARMNAEQAPVGRHRGRIARAPNGEKP